MSIYSERLDGARFHITNINHPIQFGPKMRKFRREINLMTLRMGRMAQNHALNNFKIEGFDDKTVQRWKPKRLKNGKKTLIDSGKMKATIGFTRTRNNAKLTTPVPYAGIHNRPVGEMRQYGGNNYPGRKFMGHSASLAKATKEMIVTRLNLAAQYPHNQV